MEEFDEIDFDDLDEEEFLDDIDGEAISSFVDTAATSALALTEMVIENNRHNDQKMTTEDIYQIYSQSFSVAVATMVQNQIS